MKVRDPIAGLRRWISGGRSAALIFSLSLVQGLAASTFLVECIPGDGTLLLEFIGQDPCHQSFGAMDVYDTTHNRPFLQVENDRTDPCVDLSLESLGLSVGAVEVSPPSISPVPLQGDTSLPAEMLAETLGGAPCFKRARDPIRDSNSNFHPLYSLRI